LHLIRRARCAGCRKIRDDRILLASRQASRAGRRRPIPDRVYVTADERLRALVRQAVDRTIDAFGPRADSLEPAARGNRVPDGNTARFPQQPMILGDKWDF